MALPQEAPEPNAADTSRRQDPWVLNAFLRAFMKDADAGLPKSCAEYQERWPDHAAVIASEYARLAAGSAVDVAPPDPHGGALGAFPVAFGRYELRRLVACGGQGAVYLARDGRGEAVAIKILSGLGTRSADQVERLRRETAVIDRLDHSGICKIREYGEHDGVPYLAMEYVEGKTLTECIAAWRTERARHTTEAEVREALDEILGVFHDIAMTLHSAHESGIVHRDIKPQNVMIRPSGAPVVLDFGIARIDGGGGATLTRTGEMLGTPSYMSPEQIDTGALRVDARSDVFSLGVTLYEAVTGERPFQAPTAEGILREIRHGEPRGPHAMDPRLPRDLDLVLAMALEKTAARRYASALELARDLGRLRRGADVAAKAPAPWTLVRRWARRHPRMAWVAAVAVVVLAAATAVALQLRANTLAALADYRRLSDAATLLELRTSADELWPAVPELVPRYRTWLERADALAASLPDHEAELRQLEERGRLVEQAEDTRSIGARAASDAQRTREHHADVRLALESRSRHVGPEPPEVAVPLDAVAARLSAVEHAPEARRLWRFENAEDQSRHDIVGALVRDLHVFLDADRRVGLRADVRSRLGFASSIERRSLHDAAARWRAAITAIADRTSCPMYAGLAITPQVGLVPLGRDPASGLHEFMDLYTARPGMTEADAVRLPDERLRQTADLGVVFVLVPTSSGLLGSKNAPDLPPHGEDVPADPSLPTSSLPGPLPLDPYFIAKYEMTRAQWDRLTGTRPSQHDGSDLGPVDSVTWIEADLWLRRAGMVLPTIRQWEHAARAGATTPWHTGADRASLQGHANLAGLEFEEEGESPVKHEGWNDGYQKPTPVGWFRPNRFGLHDVHGNVCEWVRDVSPDYSLLSRPGDGAVAPAAKPSAVTRVKAQRGGSYRRDAILCTVSYNLPKTAHIRDYESGVRAARDLDR